MDARDAIVTLKSLTPKRNPNESESESMEALPEAKTPEGKLRLARYEQIMQRLQQETDEVGSDVMITVQDREVSLAQSKIAEEAEAATRLAVGRPGSQVRHRLQRRRLVRLDLEPDRLGRSQGSAPDPAAVDHRGRILPGDLRVAICRRLGHGPVRRAEDRRDASARWPASASSTSRCTSATSTTRAPRRKWRSAS